MTDPKSVRERARDLMSELAVEVFKLNGLMLEQGSRTTAGSGLSVPRLRVLGVLVRSRSPLTVPHIARDIGFTRQNVQRLADVMVSDGFLVYQDNPAHAKSRLLALTPMGRAAYEDLSGKRRESVLDMIVGLDPEALAQAVHTLRDVGANLEAKLGV